MEVEDDANIMTGWIREQATLLNKPYGEIQRILLVPTARGHKSLFSKWLAYKKTVPLSKPLQMPTQLYDYSAQPTTPYVRGVIDDKPEEDEYEEYETAGSSGRVVWRKREEGDDRWYIPKQFQNPRGKPKEKPKGKKVRVKVDEVEEFPVAPIIKQYRPMTTQEAYDNQAYIDRLKRDETTLRDFREEMERDGMDREILEYENRIANTKHKIRILLESREIGGAEGKGMRNKKNFGKKLGEDLKELFGGGVPTNEISGGALKASELKALLKASYSGEKKVGDFVLDKRLSTQTSKVYYNPTTQQTVVAHKGTEGLTDWMNNIAFAVGGRWLYEKTDRFKEAERVQRGAEAAYGTDNLSTIGHSQGALQSEILGQKGKEVITLNKPSRPFEKSASSKQTDIRTERDPVSIFTDPDITIESESWNPLTEHSTDVLDRLDPERMIGEGLKSVNQKIHHFKRCIGMGVILSTPQSPAYREYSSLIGQRNRMMKQMKRKF